MTGYRLWRQVDENAWTVRVNSLLATALSHTDPGLSVDQVYRYRVQALSDEGPGVFTAVQALAVMTAPAVPDPVTGLTVVATGYSLQLGWTRGATGGLPTAYRVGWAPAGTMPLEETTVIGTTHELTDLVPNTAYDLQVTAFNQEGAAAATAGTGTTRQVTPGDPVTLTVTVQGQDAVVNWRASVAGGRPDSYELQHRLPMDSWPTTATAVAAVPHTLPGLGYEQDLEVRVRAVNTAGQSAWVEVAFTTGREPMVPDVPAGLRAQPSADSQMQLRWTAAPTGGVATGYRIERSADVSPRDWQEAVGDTGSTATTWADRGLDASTIYHYRVAGFNAEGAGAVSAEATGTTRPQLTLNATAPYPLTAHQWPAALAPVTHTWSAHEATVHDVAAQGPGGGWWRVVRFGQGTSGPYWIPAGAGTVSGTTSTLPAAAGLPGDLMATATHASVSLSWRAPLSGGTVTGYRVWRQTGEEAYAGRGGDLAATALTHTDTSVTGSTAYQYRLQALAAAGPGPRTAAVGITTAMAPMVPGLPTGLTAQPTADSQMHLRWQAPADPGSQALSGYRIERAVAAPPRVWTEVVADTGNLDLIWDDSGLDASTVYHYRVSARNRVGAGAASGEAMGTTRPQLVLRANASYPLTAHAWPAATAPATHSWSAPETTVFDLVGQGPGGGGWWRLLRFGQGASGPYWVTAAAVTTTGTTPGLPQAPGQPGDLMARVSAGTVTLSWTAPTSGAPVTAYRLWRQPGEEALAPLGSDLAATALTYTDSAVTASTTYLYRVQALAAGGPGARTATVSAVLPPAAPTGLSSLQTGVTTLDLEWDPEAGVTGYDLQFWAEDTAGHPWVLLDPQGSTAVTNGSQADASITLARTDTLARVAGLPDSYSLWRFQARARNAGGESAWSGTHFSVRRAGPYRPAAAPSL